MTPSTDKRKALPRLIRGRAACFWRCRSTVRARQARRSLAPIFRVANFAGAGLASGVGLAGVVAVTAAAAAVAAVVVVVTATDLGLGAMMGLGAAGLTGTGLPTGAAGGGARVVPNSDRISRKSALSMAPS